MSTETEQDRENTRQFFIDTWEKYRDSSILQPLESLVAGVIIQHPEYHELLENPAALDAEFDPESGQSNPFLHMGLHISLQEQIGADRPTGIRELYEMGLQNLGDAHTLEHRLMECLAEMLWEAQRAQRMPDEAEYLERVRQLVTSF